MTHQITPPPDLVQQWAKDRVLLCDRTPLHEYISTRAAQWGANQELEACCEAIKDRVWFAQPAFRLAELRAARRPKQPSLKELALQKLAWIEDESTGDQAAFDTIRRALEALPDD
jgi:hypothetical protein